MVAPLPMKKVESSPEIWSLSRSMVALREGEGMGDIIPPGHTVGPVPTQSCTHSTWAPSFQQSAEQAAMVHGCDRVPQDSKSC